jgi:NADH:ubiquinone oxidoreductase subunit 6 (subunit J)
VSFLDGFVDLLPTLGFIVLAAVILVSAWMVSHARRITHAVFFMVLAFTGVAGVFILLGADFLAWSQILVYVGAIAVMFLFAIMVSDLKEISDTAESPAAARRGRAPWLVLSGLVAVGFAGLVLASLARAGVPPGAVPAAAGEPTTLPIARELFTTFLVPFEVASVVLLVALVGAIVLAAREESAGSETAGSETAGAGADAADRAGPSAAGGGRGETA